MWEICDILQPLVAHAGGVRQIAEVCVKTDKEDVKRLLRLLIADIRQRCECHLSLCEN